MRPTTLSLKILPLLVGFVLFAQALSAQTLPNPTISYEPSCAADYVLLRAESEIVDDDLVFIWYDKNLTVLGRQKGPNGWNEFITPFLIRDEVFYVSVELNGESSSRQKVTVDIIHTPRILENPWVQLCGGVVLHGDIDLFGTFASVSYQWQRLTAQNEQQVVFQDIEGEKSETLDVSETGIFRLKVLLDSCVAISEDVEVTEELVAQALPEGVSDYCYRIDNAQAESVTYYSEHYRQGLTTVEWYRSNDGGLTYTELISTDRTVNIVKPSTIVDTEETWYYRLIVSEQNCSHQDDFEITWSPKPQGSIQHLNGSEDNFFYCEEDDAASRTLVAVSLANVDVYWYRLLDTSLPKEQIENYSSRSGIELEQMDSLFQFIGTGDELILNQKMGGLIIARFVDQDNGCVDYSSNSIFADTAFPFPEPLFEDPLVSSYLFNGVCMGQANLELQSWDETGDSYTWHYSKDNSSYDQVGSEPTYLMNSIDQPGDIEGYYKMGIEKNGCYAESAPFYIFEGDPVEAEIIASDTEFCVSSDITLSSANQGEEYIYEWYEVNELDSVLSRGAAYQPEQAGTYILKLSSGFCTTVSDMVQIEQLSLPEAKFSHPLDPSEVFCSSVHAQLVEERTDDTYTWYQSSNNFNFSQISDEENSDYLMAETGFYFATVVNSIGCQSNSDTLYVADRLDGELNYQDTAYSCGAGRESTLWLKSPKPNQSYQWWYSPDNISPYAEAGGLDSLSIYAAIDLGFYRLELSGEHCSLTTDAIELKEAPEETIPEAVIEGENAACSGEPIELISVGSGLTSSYTWYHSTVDNELIPFVDENKQRLIFNAGQFADNTNPVQEVKVYLGVKEGNCSALSDPLTIKAVKKPQMIVRNDIYNSTEDVFVCDLENTAFNLEAFQYPANASIDYQWSVYNSLTDGYEILASEQEKVLAITSPGLYQCLGVVPGTTCAGLSNPVQVTAPPRGISGDTTFCYGGFYDVWIDAGSLLDEDFNSFDYSWYYSPNADGFHLIDTAQSVHLTIPSGDEGINGGYFFYRSVYNSCYMLSDTFFVKEDVASVQIDIAAQKDQVKGRPFEVSASTKQSGISVQWEPADYVQETGDDHVIFTVPEDYSEDQLTILAIATSKTCSSFQELLINLRASESIEFSKIITPNGDNYNDTFRITGLDPNQPNVLRIFDAWGKLLFEIENYDSYSAVAVEMAKKLDKGTYYYVFTTGGQTYKGNFNVKK